MIAGRNQRAYGSYSALLCGMALEADRRVVSDGLRSARNVVRVVARFAGQFPGALQEALGLAQAIHGADGFEFVVMAGPAA